MLWGTGFGQTWPPIATSMLPAVAAPLADPGGLQVTVGGRTATVRYVRPDRTATAADPDTSAGADLALT